MKLQLKEWKATEISFKAKDAVIEMVDQKNELFDFSMGHFFDEGNLHEFGILLFIRIHDDKFDLSVEMMFNFETDQEISADFKESDFVKINAPAIAFPYLRSFISNITLQSGFLPVILPAVNFAQLAKN